MARDDFLELLLIPRRKLRLMDAAPNKSSSCRLNPVPIVASTLHGKEGRRKPTKVAIPRGQEGATQRRPCRATCCDPIKLDDEFRNKSLRENRAALRALGIIIRTPWRSVPELLVNNDFSSGTHVQLVKLHVLLTRL